MSIHIGDHNRFTNVTIAEKIDHEPSKKTFAERHPIWIGLFCSFVVGGIELRKTVSGRDSLDDWIRFFNARSEEDLDMIQTKNAGINMAIGEVKKMSMSERMRARYEAHMKEVRDRNAREHYVKEVGRKEGKTEGKTEGRIEGRAQLIANMLANGKTPEEIVQLCNCDLQEIKDVAEGTFLLP